MKFYLIIKNFNYQIINIFAQSCLFYSLCYVLIIEHISLMIVLRESYYDHKMEKKRVAFNNIAVLEMILSRIIIVPPSFNCMQCHCQYFF
uniref:Uncharacterized protein n=1 Tax=viral metagenome TaxID=1070528 RepID=A0A6C0C9C0_9ZZZZ